MGYATYDLRKRDENIKKKEYDSFSSRVKRGLTSVPQGLSETEFMQSSAEYINKKPTLGKALEYPVGIVKGITDVSKADIPVAGTVIEATQIGKLLSINQKIKSGSATDTEMLWANDFLKLQEEEAKKQEQPGYGIGSTIKDSVSFMAELGLASLATPITGGGSLATLFGAKATIKGATKIIKELVKDKATREILASVVKKSAKKTAVESALVGGLHTPQGTLERMTGTPEFNEKGEFSKLADDGQDLGEAFINSATDNITEVVSERAGEVFSLFGSPIKNSILKAGILKSATKLNPNISPNKIAELFRKSGWNGIVNEYLEERTGDVMRGSMEAIGLGDQEFKMPTLKQSAEEIASFALMGTAFKAAEKTLGKSGRIVEEDEKTTTENKEKEEAKKTVQEVIKNTPRIVENLITNSVDKPVSVEDVSGLEEKDIKLLSLGLQSLKVSFPELDVKNIDTSLEVLKETGVELPKVEVVKKPKTETKLPEKTPVEKPVLAKEKPVTKKDVEKIVEKPLQEGGLISEAKKYKTEEEFIKAQGEPKFHATDQQFNSFKKNDLGTFLTDKQGAKNVVSYDRKRFKNVREVYVKANNTFDVNEENLTKIFKEDKDFAAKFDGYSLSSFGDNPKKFVKAVIDKIKESVPKARKELINELKNKGFDSYRLSKDRFGSVYDENFKVIKSSVVFDENAIKTKSQLSNIYKKAHSQPQGIPSTKKTLKLKYPELSKEELQKRKEIERNKPGNTKTNTDRLLEGKKLSKQDLKREGIIIRKEEVLSLMKNSPDFKSGSVLTMKDGLLRFEGKSHKFGIKPSALGLSEVKEGTKITVNEADLKDKKAGQIPSIMYKKKSSAELSELQNHYNRLKIAYDNAPTKQAKKRINKAMSAVQKQYTRYKEQGDIKGQILDDINEIAKFQWSFINPEYVKANIEKYSDDYIGQYINQAITYFSNPSVETISHESFHAIFDLLIPEHIQNKLLNIAIKEGKISKEGKTKKKLKYEAEEYLSKEFENIVALLENKAPVKLTKIQRVFKEIVDFFKKLVGIMNEKEKLFSDILTGKFAKGGLKMNIPRGGEVATRFKEKELLTEKGSLRVSEVLKAEWKRVYGEEAPKKVIDMLHQNDVELVMNGIRRGFVTGKQAQRIKQQEDNVEKRIKQAEKNKKLRKEITQKFKDKTTSQDEKRSLAKRYIENNLPKELRGEYLTVVEKTKSDITLEKAIKRVDSRKGKYEKRQLIKSINKVLTKLKFLPVASQKEILVITNQIQLKHHTKALLDKIATNKMLYESLSEDLKNNTSFKVLEELKILDRTPLAELSTQKLMEINNKIQQLAIIGRYELKQKKEDKLKTKEDALKELSDPANSENLDLKNEKERYDKVYKSELSIGKKAILKFKGVREWVREVGYEQEGTDRFIRRLDKGNDDLTGSNARLVFNPVNDDVDVAHQRIDEFREESLIVLDTLNREILRDLLKKEGKSDYSIDEIINPDVNAKKSWHRRAKEFRYFIKMIKIREQISQDIGIMAQWEQQDVKEKLLKNNKMDIAEIERTIERVKSSPAQLKMYQYMRKRLDMIHPELSKKYTQLNPTTSLGFIKNFFPNKTDFSITDETIEKDIIFKATINFSSLKKRLIGGNQIIDLNSISNFQNYIEAAIFYIETAESVQRSSAIIESEEYTKAIGVKAQNIAKKWLLITSKRGGHIVRPKIFEKWIDYFRKNIGPAYLGLRPTTIARQTMASANGAAVIGGKYQVLGTEMMFQEKWRTFMIKNSVQMKNRVGGDILFKELSEGEAIRALQNISMKGVQLADYGPAGATFLGAYAKKMKELGKDPDSMIMDKDILRYCNLQVRLGHGTAQFNYAPQVLFNENRSLMRAFHIFETFILAQWSQISKDLPATYKRNKKEGVKMATWIMLNFTGQAAITAGHAAIIASLLGDGDDDEKEFKYYLGNELIQAVPYLNKLGGMIRYGSTPIMVDNFVADVISDLRWSFMGKKDETRRKHQIKLLAALLSFYPGLPVKYPSEILQKMIEENKSNSNF